MNWRIYRLPGSREMWLIDHGPGSIVLQAMKWEMEGPVKMRSHNGDPAKTPRAWIAVSQSDLHLTDGVATFLAAKAPLAGSFSPEKGPISCAS